jgi:hypothetical protein
LIINQTYLDRIASGDEDLVEILQEYLDEEGDRDYIDRLGGLCEMGGYPDENTYPQYSVKSAECVEGKVVFLCDVFFDEKVFGGGCPDMPTIEARSGVVTYELNLGAGKLSAVSDIDK